MHSVNESRWSCQKSKVFVSIPSYLTLCRWLLGRPANRMSRPKNHLKCTKMCTFKAVRKKVLFFCSTSERNTLYIFFFFVFVPQSPTIILLVCATSVHKRPARPIIRFRESGPSRMKYTLVDSLRMVHGLRVGPPSRVGRAVAPSRF